MKNAMFMVAFASSLMPCAANAVEYVGQLEPSGMFQGVPLASPNRVKVQLDTVPIGAPSEGQVYFEVGGVVTWNDYKRTPTGLVYLGGNDISGALTGFYGNALGAQKFVGEYWARTDIEEIAFGIERHWASRVTGTSLFNSSGAPISYRIAFLGTVPEPATWAGLVVGLSVAGGSLRLRRRTKAPAID